MSGFSAEWLALREPYDLAARNATVLDAMLAAFRGQASISVVDLACGTGATLRAIGARLPARQNWRLVDNDLGLLAQAAALGRPPECMVDGARHRSRARSRTGARRPGRPDHHLGAARSRLGGWLERLAVEAAARRLPVYAALSYDGRVDVRSGRAVRSRDRRGGEPASARQQGLWPALGPDAAAARRCSASSASAIRSSRARPTGCSARTTRRSSARCCAALPMPPASSRDLPAAHIADWLARRRELRRRRPLQHARRSRRFLRDADADPLSGEVAVEQHLVAEDMRAHRRPQRLVDPLDRREA